MNEPTLQTIFWLVTQVLNMTFDFVNARKIEKNKANRDEVDMLVEQNSRQANRIEQLENAVAEWQTKYADCFREGFKYEKRIATLEAILTSHNIPFPASE